MDQTQCDVFSQKVTYGYSQGLQFISEIFHFHAPLFVYKKINLKLKCPKEKSNISGYWQLNNDILGDKYFKGSVQKCE